MARIPTSSSVCDWRAHHVDGFTVGIWPHGLLTGLASFSSLSLFESVHKPHDTLVTAIVMTIRGPLFCRPSSSYICSHRSCPPRTRLLTYSCPQTVHERTPPGSGRFPPRNWDSELTYKGQSCVPCLARAGDVTLFVSDVWHRRMPTLPGNPGRYFLQVHYGRRDIAQRIQPTARVNHVTPTVIAHAKQMGAPELVGIHEPSFYDG